jgi:DNA invertase Pin-like site-specific DNA recombinase
MRKPATDPSKAVAYLRCSTERQDLSPDAQRDAIAAWAATNGVEVVAWHEDLGVSGGTELEKRPGLLAATEALRTEGAGVLVVAKRDRLARDVLTAALVERLAERAGARVVAADGTGNGDGPEAALLRTMIDAFAAYERALIRSRTKAALAVKRAKGERIGGIPYGFAARDDGTLVPEPREQAAVALARTLRAQGRSLRAIGAALEAAGHWPRIGRRWHVQVIKRLASA